MTREQAKRLLPIIQAFAEGRTIQYKNEYGLWIEIDCPIWSKFCQYRIKPEAKYRPFKTQEECWEEMLKHAPFGYLRNIKSSNIVQITGMSTVSYRELHIDLSVNQHSFYTADSLFEVYTFADGTPFGIKEKVQFARNVAKLKKIYL